MRWLSLAVPMALLLLASTGASAGLKIDQADERQIAALVLTGKVWGFLKYHHPAVTAGQRQWDDELLSRLPAVMAARKPGEVHALLVQWIDALGPIEDCRDCAVLGLDGGDVQQGPRLGWISDRKLLGVQLSQRLQRIHRNRVRSQQHYVQLAPGVGNALFVNEPNYPDASFPDSGLQILGVLRFWNAVEYWFPHRELTDGDWDRVLADTLRRVAPPLAPAAWHRELYRLTARLRDGHAGILGKVTPREPSGPCRLPVSLRVVDREFVVEDVLADDEVAHRFQPGDVLRSIDGKAVDDIVAGVRDWYGASNEPARLFAIGRTITHGACGDARVGVMRNQPLTLDVQRVVQNGLRILPVFFNDREGETFQMLPGGIAYLKLSTIRNEDLPGYLEKMSGANALVVDIRNYPSAFVVFTLGQALVDAPTPFVVFSGPDLANPGLFRYGQPLQLQPAQPHSVGAWRCWSMSHRSAMPSTRQWHCARRRVRVCTDARQQERMGMCRTSACQVTWPRR